MDIIKNFDSYTIGELRSLLARLGGAPCNKKKAELINEINQIRSGQMTPTRSKRGRPSSRVKSNYEKYNFDNNEFSLSFHDVAKDKVKTEVEGLLQITAEGFGFLRTSNMFSDRWDAFVSKELIEKHNLRYGDKVKGVAERLSVKRHFELKTILKVNDGPLTDKKPKCFYSYDIQPVNKKIELGDNSLNLLNLVCPLGFGQRCGVIAPPESGKTTFIKQTVESLKNKSGVKTVVLVIDEKPEDIKDIQSVINNEEYFYSTFDQSPKYHIHLAEIAVNRAKVLAENGDNVVLIIDSVTNLVNAYLSSGEYNDASYASIMDAILRVKGFLMLARSTVGASLTIISTIKIGDTLLEETVLNQVSSVCNMQIVLDNILADKRVFPAINLNETKNKYINNLLNEEQLSLYGLIRQALILSKDNNERLIKAINKNYKDHKKLILNLKEIIEVSM